VLCTVLQRREGEANAWEKWLTLRNLLFIQGYTGLHCTRIWVIRWVWLVNRCIFTYCVLIHSFVWLYNNNGKNNPKTMVMFSVCTVHIGGTLILASPSRRRRLVEVFRRVSEATKYWWWPQKQYLSCRIWFMQAPRESYWYYHWHRKGKTRAGMESRGLTSTAELFTQILQCNSGLSPMSFLHSEGKLGF
jgi:hypothetical protein